MRGHIIASVLFVLAATAPAAAQDVITLEGEPAIRFLAGHGHLRTYCLGVLYITPTRIRFDSYVTPPHSYNLARAEIKDVDPGDLLGFHYLKVVGKDDNYRMAIAPDLVRAFGDRVQLALRAYKDFEAARAEVERVAAQRAVDRRMVTARMTPDGPALQFSAMAHVGMVYSWGQKKGTEWEPADAAADAYRTLPAAVGGLLTVTPKGIAFRSTGADADKLSFEGPMDEVRVVAGAGGYPRVVLNVRRVGRVTLFLGEFTDEPIIDKGKQVGFRKLYYEASPLLRALDPKGFQQLAAELLPRPTLVVASSPGAQVFVDGQPRGTVGPDGALRLAELPPGEHKLSATLAGHQEFAQAVQLAPGEEKRVEAKLVAVAPPPPPKPAGPPPFTLKDLLAMLEGGVAARRVGALVQERGVDFPLDDNAEQSLRRAGADAELLVVVAKSKK